ncbi:MAG: glutathione S-transferase family protein [Panacagrimonas sp.]
MSPAATVLRIVSYLPNPRIWKATIAARLCGVEVEVRGASPQELADWLWDFDARPLSPEEKLAAAGLQRTARTGFGGRLFKTDAFLAAHPFGTVPAAFSPDGRVGIFESNSIMRGVARLGADRFALYGHDAYSASRIDSFLDASLVFARDTQHYILALRAGLIATELHAQTQQALGAWLAAIERALVQTGDWIVEAGLSLADICFACELALLHNEHLHRRLLEQNGLEPILGPALRTGYPAAMKHFDKLCAHAAFEPDMAPFLRRIAEASA